MSLCNAKDFAKIYPSLSDERKDSVAGPSNHDPPSGPHFSKSNVPRPDSMLTMDHSTQERRPTMKHTMPASHDTQPSRPSDPDDADLLRLFITRRDDRAFAALVARHGPMVLGICRRV